MKRSNNKGFSLVELIVVVAIMAVLVGVLAPSYLKYVEKAREQICHTNADNYIRAIAFEAQTVEEYRTYILSCKGAPNESELLETYFEANWPTEMPSCPSGGDYNYELQERDGVISILMTCSNHTRE